jgi:hypothetical protein
MDYHVGDTVTVAGLMSGPTPPGRIATLNSHLANVEWPPGAWLGADGLPYPMGIRIAAPLSWLVPAGE